MLRVIYIFSHLLFQHPHEEFAIISLIFIDQKSEAREVTSFGQDYRASEGHHQASTEIIS